MLLFGCFVFFCLVFVFVFWPSGLRTRLCALGSAGGWWGFAVPPVAFFGCWGFAWGGPCLCVCFLRAVPLLFVFFFLRAVPCFFLFLFVFLFLCLFARRAVSSLGNCPGIRGDCLAGGIASAGCCSHGNCWRNQQCVGTSAR